MENCNIDKLNMLSDLKSYLNEIIIRERVELSAKFRDQFELSLNFLDGAIIESVVIYDSKGSTSWVFYVKLVLCIGCTWLFVLSNLVQKFIRRIYSQHIEIERFDNDPSTLCECLSIYTYTSTI